jgi:hypothetical protein
VPSLRSFHPSCSYYRRVGALRHYNLDVRKWAATMLPSDESERRDEHMMTPIRRRTPMACIALAVAMLPNTSAIAIGVGGVGGAAVGHVSAGGTAGGGAGHAGAQGSGRGGPNQHFDHGQHGEREIRHPQPWSPYPWLGGPYPRCQIDKYGRQHCY